MRTLVLLIVALGVALAAPNQSSLDEQAWKDFKKKYGKDYKVQAEDNRRKAIFLETCQRVENHNKQQSSFKLAVNEFADITIEEFTSEMTGFIPTASNSNGRVPRATCPYSPRGRGQNSYNRNAMNNNSKTSPSSGAKPARKSFWSFLKSWKTNPHRSARQPNAQTLESKNWNDVGAVTTPRRQGVCGSCYAFSAVGAIEGQYYIASGELVNFSPQNLVDCSNGYEPNAGCKGGDPAAAFEYIKVNKGIARENEYLYRSELSNRKYKCKYNSKMRTVAVKDYVKLASGCEDELQRTVHDIGPISVSIHTTKNFKDYGTGVLDDKTCSNEKIKLNHSVLVVGYGTDPIHGKYWLVKNSHGVDWGEGGFFRIVRNKQNQCGIATEAVYPIL